MRTVGRELWHELTDLASDLAVEAGDLAQTLAASARSDPWTKSSSSDLVTTADTAVEELITSRIAAVRPDDTVIGEEGTATQGSTSIVWHVDPIDGTTNYVYGIRSYAVSIAAEIDGDVVAAVVNNPSSSELYTATRSAGARCNGEPLACRDEGNLAKALVATGFGYRAERRLRQGAVLAALLGEIRDIRRFGSAALDLCAVASGQVDAYYEGGLNRWDMAAGALIAAEAGATVANLAGGPPDQGFLLTAGPRLFPSLQRALMNLGATPEE